MLKMMTFDSSYYGSYRTMTFLEIAAQYDKFEELFNNLPQLPLTPEEIQLTYYLLAARYGNCHIANSDINQYTLQLYSTILQYGPTWAKRYDIQKKLRELSLDELQQGSKAIYNNAFNPDTAPSTAALEELPRIAAQNTTNYKRSKLEAYGQLWELLETDVTEDYLNKFKKLFIQVLAPDYPLLYTTEEQYGTV